MPNAKNQTIFCYCGRAEAHWKFHHPVSQFPQSGETSWNKVNGIPFPERGENPPTPTPHPNFVVKSYFFFVIEVKILKEVRIVKEVKKVMACDVYLWRYFYAQWKLFTLTPEWRMIIIIHQFLSNTRNYNFEETTRPLRSPQSRSTWKGRG